MIITITDKCNFMCSHCMHSCIDKGDFIDRYTFDNCIKFIIRNKVRVVSLSGGEPTLHPDLGYFLERLDSLKTCAFSVISNGSNILKDGKITTKYMNYLEKYKFLLYEMRNDTRYYSHKVKYNDYHERVNFSNEVYYIKKTGRAKNIEVRNNPNMLFYPSCLDYYSNVLIFKRMRELINIRFDKLKTCDPCIDMHGDIYICELIKNTEPVGNVNNYNEKKILENIKKVKCIKCLTEQVGCDTNYIYKCIESLKGVDLYGK